MEAKDNNSTVATFSDSENDIQLMKRLPRRNLIPRRKYFKEQRPKTKFLRQCRQTHPENNNNKKNLINILADGFTVMRSVMCRC